MLSKIHAYLRGAHGHQGGNTETPRGKEYPRMPRIPLPPALPLKTSLEEVLLTRTSCRDFMEGGSIDISGVATILNHALGVRSDGKRPYPSGGGLFPIETYLINRTVSGIPSGVFHYLPEAHALEHLWDISAETTIFKNLKKADWAETGSAVLVFTSVWMRSSREYGDFSYNLAHLEAGHMAQNVLLSATALEIGSCPLGGYNDESVARLLDLNEEEEQPIYTIMLCPTRESDPQS